MAIRYVLEDQIERNARNIAVYMGKLKKLPKGSLHQRKRGDRVYYYIKYRDETGKRVDQYVKADLVEEIKKKLGKRKEYLDMIRGLQEDIKIAKKGLR